MRQDVSSQVISGHLRYVISGLFEFGETRYDHLFDGMALLHSWTILDGVVTYRSRFLQSETFKKNKAANRIVVGEFGTAAFPDPCKTIFNKFSSVYKVCTPVHFPEKETSRHLSLDLGLN